MAETPNIFRRATSELSQDAFLAWLCEWADESHASHPSGMHAVGRAFIAWLHGRKGWPVPPYTKTEVRLQHLHIDVLVKLIVPNGEAHYLLIEDKTNTSDYTEQINGYLRSLKEKEGLEDTSRILTVYFKSSLEARKSDEHMRLYLPDIVEFIRSLDLSSIQSEVLCSWCDVRAKAWWSHEQFRSIPVHKWEEDQWYGCFDYMAQRPEFAILKAGYGYVPLGDFIGFWLGWVGEPNDWCTYLQIDVYRSKPPALTFRIAAPKDDLVSPAFMRGTFNSLQSAASSMGKNVRYPKWARIGGKSSRYAVLDERFMTHEKDGLFNEALMSSQLLACHELLRRAPIQHLL